MAQFWLPGATVEEFVWDFCDGRGTRDSTLVYLPTAHRSQGEQHHKHIQTQETEAFNLI